MRFVHWLSFLTALLALAAIAAVQALQPAAGVAVPGLGTVPLVWALGTVFALGFLAGWVYLPGYAWVLARERRAWKRERSRLESELAKLRPQEVEELPRIPDRPAPDSGKEDA